MQQRCEGAAVLSIHSGYSEYSQRCCVLCHSRRQRCEPPSAAEQLGRRVVQCIGSTCRLLGVPRVWYCRALTVGTPSTPLRTRVLIVPHHPAWCGAAAERVRVDAHARPDELVLRGLTCAGCSLLPSIGSADPQQRVRRAHERETSSAANEEAKENGRRGSCSEAEGGRGAMGGPL
jgi:hypothetical protein